MLHALTATLHRRRVRQAVLRLASLRAVCIFLLIIVIGRVVFEVPLWSSYPAPSGGHQWAESSVSAGNVVVVAGSDTFFDGVLNLIGSVKIWAPSAVVLVYDLNLSADNVQRLFCVEGVQVPLLGSAPSCRSHLGRHPACTLAHPAFASTQHTHCLR
jgi:hypothetical protein